MAHSYDAIIIGTGQAGPSLAAELAAAGMRTAVIERHLFGGTCVNVGCIPTKALVASARAAHVARRAADFGVVIGGDVGVDMGRVKARKDAIVRRSATGVERWLKSLDNCTVYQGHGRFAGDHRVRVGDEVLEAERIFINVGARAFVPPFRGVEEVDYLTNSSIMELNVLPEHLMIVGGGYIGLEFAQMFRRFGSEVTLIDRGDRLIKRESEDVSAAVAAILESEGVRLRAVRKEIESGAFPYSVADEDIHMNIERRLTEKVGAVGEKLHTARSRNDQVSLDMRLYLREALDGILGDLEALQKALGGAARRNEGVLMPGYTHLQRAQPVLFAHHLLAYVEMFERDKSRYRHCRAETDVLPLGSGALAGTSFPIDRAYVAELLGFPRLSENSIDAVSDRDFVLEFLSASAILFVHLSRMADELILWSSEEFGFIELPDGFCTGSSMMPQKKNPDVAELIRGKTGRVYGHLNALLTIMKGLPLAYNRDLQEDKEPLFDTVDTVSACLLMARELLNGLRVRSERMLAAAEEGFMNATDLADYLAGRGLSFRAAHDVVGRLVRHCIDTGQKLQELSLDELRGYCPGIGADVYKILTVRAGVERRRAPGGTASANVRRRLKKLGV